MGILEHVSGLEDVASGGEEKLKQKPKKAESVNPDFMSNSRLEKIEGSVASLTEAVEDLKNGARSPTEAQPSSEAMEKLQSDIEALRETVGNLEKEKSSEDKSEIQDILRRLDEMEGAVNGGRDYSGEIGELRKSVSEIRNSIAAGAAKAGDPAKAQAKDLLELKSRMDVLQKYVDGRMGALQVPQKEGSDRATEEMINSRLNEFSRRIDEISKSAGANRNIEEKMKSMDEKVNSVRNDTARMISDALKNVPKPDDIRKGVDERISFRIAEFSKKVEELSRYDLNKLKNVADAEKKIDENLKLFALNSDVEKVWKETESLRRYIDEKTKMADGLANSLRVWETRNMQVMEKERGFDEKMKAFPELKMLDSRIRKTERALVELQKHFVAAQITEPIIME